MSDEAVDVKASRILKEDKIRLRYRTFFRSIEWQGYVKV